MAILEVKHLTYSYGGETSVGHDAIHDISFAVEQGEILGIVGHTGSGKSTLVQHLNGLLKPVSGEVLLDGEDIWRNPKEIRRVRARVGLVFQYPEYQLFEDTVFADISFGPKNMGLTGEELENRVKETCALIGVKPEYYEKSPFDLSGGEKRRVAIAGVMAMRPQVIILDEPTAGLDPSGREEIIRMIRNYRAATQAAVLIVSHSMEDMAVLADRLLVLNGGRLEMLDTPKQVFRNGDRLREIGLNTPIVTRVFDALRAAGAPVSPDVFTVEQAVRALTALKEGAPHA